MIRIALPVRWNRMVLGGMLAVLLGACGSKGPKPAKLTHFSPSAKLGVAWQSDIGDAGRYIFAPAVHGDSVFAASAGGDLARFSAANGKTLWRLNTRAPLSGGVGVSANLVLVGTAKGVVLAYDLAGKPLWQSKVSSEVLGSPQATSEFVVVRSGDNRIFGLDARDGSRRWEYQTLAPALTLRSNPGVIVIEGFVIAGMPSGKLVVLNLANGGLVWETVVAAPKGDNELERITDIAGLPLVEAGRVCAVTFQGRVACYETQKGSQLWARPASGVGSLAVDELNVYLSDAAGSVLSFDKSSGASVWKQDKLSHRNLSAPLVVAKHVVVGDFEGRVHFLKHEDGSFAARIATDGGGIFAAPQSIDGDTVLIQTRRGGIYAIAVKGDSVGN